MSGIWMTGASLVGGISELAGYKSGMALSRGELRRIFRDSQEFRDFWPSNFEHTIRIRPEEYESLVAWVLYKLGNIDSPSTAPASIVLLKKYARTENAETFASVMQAVVKFLGESVIEYDNSPQPKKRSIDPTPLIRRLVEQHGRIGAEIGIELLEGIERDRHRSPWGATRTVEWTETVALKDLFHDEGLTTNYGTFFDQRFVDYLARNFEDIDAIHWRKFEALTGEYFTREGFRVELGPGRGDDGVDARVFREHDVGTAPTLLIQCKRQKEKVGKVVVKAMYADVVNEGATSGLIVTTSALSPGAKTTCVARSYPVSAAERRTLALWIAKMKTPRSGVFMGE